MPIEIRELVIKAVVNSSSQKATNSGAGADSEGQGGGRSKLENTVEQILETLKENKNER